MKKYGLIGKQLSHSWSARYFAEKFEREHITDCEYALYPLDSLSGLRQWVSETKISGFNVTIPYKIEVMQHLDELSPEAAAIGAVNCVDVHSERQIGHNTDCLAFADTLLPLLRAWHTHALILGTGGAAKAVAEALRRLGIECTFVSRTPSGINTIGYEQAVALAPHCTIIVNATPVGTATLAQGSPWHDFSVITERHLCYDLTYNPIQTPFLQMCEKQGATVCNGLAMLHRQAELSWEIWNATKVS